MPFGAMTSNRGARWMMPYSDIFKGKPYENWHHYALVWDVGGISEVAEINGVRPTLAILFDGEVIGCKAKSASDEASIKAFLDSPVLLGIPMRKEGPSFNNKSSYLMDDLKIWNYAKTEFDLSKCE